MTAEDFLAFYPQFSGVIPEAVIGSFTESANLRFGDLPEDAEEARRLLTAHRLTLYARSMPVSAVSGGVAAFAALASAGSGERIVSKRVDDVSVSYSSPAAGSAGELGETVFGQQLLSLLKRCSFPVYVP